MWAKEEKEWRRKNEEGAREGMEVRGKGGGITENKEEEEEVEKEEAYWYIRSPLGPSPR